MGSRSRRSSSSSLAHSLTHSILAGWDANNTAILNAPLIKEEGYLLPWEITINNPRLTCSCIFCNFLVITEDQASVVKYENVYRKRKGWRRFKKNEKFRLASIIIVAKTCMQLHSCILAWEQALMSIFSVIIFYELKGKTCFTKKNV